MMINDSQPKESKFKVLIECYRCGSNKCSITEQDHDVLIKCLSCYENAMGEWDGLNSFTIGGNG